MLFPGCGGQCFSPLDRRIPILPNKNIGLLLSTSTMHLWLQGCCWLLFPFLHNCWGLVTGFERVILWYYLCILPCLLDQEVAKHLNTTSQPRNMEISFSWDIPAKSFALSNFGCYQDQIAWHVLSFATNTLCCRKTTHFKRFRFLAWPRKSWHFPWAFIVRTFDLLRLARVF